VLVRLLGLLTGVLVLLTSSFDVPKAPSVVFEKTLDQYWAEAGLEPKELLLLLKNNVCFSSSKFFLACSNAIIKSAEKVNLKLQAASLTLVPLNSHNTDSGLSEKLVLQNFARRFAHFKDKDNDKDFRKDFNTNFNKDFSTDKIAPNLFQRLFMEVAKNGKTSQSASLVAAGLNGFLSIYKDPHTYLVPLKYYQEVLLPQESQNKQFGFTSFKSKGILRVKKVFEGSPAEAVQLRRGDSILSVNGKSTSEFSISGLNEWFRSPRVERITLEVRSAHSGKIRTLRLVKSSFAQKNVTSRYLSENGNLGLVTIHRFGKGSCGAFQDHVRHLQGFGIRGLLLDLRDNPGGQVEEAACIAGSFFDKGTKLFETRFVNGRRPSEIYFSEQNKLYAGPMAILINSGTASAAEIVAGALQDQNRAILVGEKSFGKGSFQDGQIWGNNKGIALFETQGLYYFPSGWTPQILGIEPDVHVAVGDSAEGREDIYWNPLVPSQHFGLPRAQGKMAAFMAQAFSNGSLNRASSLNGGALSGEKNGNTGTGRSGCSVSEELYPLGAGGGASIGSDLPSFYLGDTQLKTATQMIGCSAFTGGN
jgi:carboxyl-terminal processing protease